ncbi:MAG: PaaI family thioesterase [Desulfobacterales bacterium]|jgi:uncharacterized protein (TIGR00369 family)
MKGDAHFRALERMYLAAPINRIFQPRIAVSKGGAEIEIAVGEKLFHAAGAVHGSVYFKMLDDAAFFAANSLVADVFVLTASFTVYLTRPISEGRMRSVGKVVSRSRTQIIAESAAYNDQGKEVGRGSGIFVKSNIALSETGGYRADGRQEA